MKKVIRLVLCLALLPILASCMTLEPAEPTIIGRWKATEDTTVYTRYFTSDGWYVLEAETPDTTEYAFGTYEDMGDSLFLEGCGSSRYTLLGKELILDGLTYTRVSRKAENNSSKIAGVWENQRYSLGLATDGLAISQGSYMNCNSYEAAENVITISGGSSEYLIINNSLYIRSFRFIKQNGIIKYERKSSGGVNRTGMSILCNNGPWFYQDLRSSDLSGDLYAFSLGGSFQGIDIINGNYGETKYGTFTLDGNCIRLSTGGTLIFAVIDETPFGYN